MSLVKQWRYLLLTILAIVALGAVAACGDDDDNGGTETPGGSETATEGPTETAPANEGGEITMQVTEPESLDPHFSDFSLDITIIGYTNRGLYDLLPGGVLQPAYAEDLPTVSDDGLTYTIPIKSGMTWADGEPLDANDFVLGIQRTCDPTIAGHYQYILTNIVGCDDYYSGEGSIDDVGVSAPDDNTLEITLSQPQATFKSILALWPTYPAPDGALASVDAEWPAPPDTPCSGPFCVTEWEAGDHLTLVKNDTWGLGSAHLDQINMRIIDDLSTAANAYVAGELDITRVAPEEVSVYEDRADFVKQALPITIGLEFLMTDPVLSDLNVRLALSRSIDRDLLNQVVNGGAYVPTTSWVPSEEPGANPAGFMDNVIGYDETAAKQALSDAGYPDGAGFPGVKMLLTDTANNRTLFEFLQEQWKNILGIDLQEDFVDSQTRQARFNDSDFQITTGGWGHDYPDAENWLVGLYNTGASINKQMCSMPAIDAALDAATTETDDAARWADLQEAEKLVLENLCGIAPLFHRGNLYLFSDKISGIEPTLEDHYDPQFPENWALTE